VAIKNWISPWEGYGRITREEIVTGRVAINDVISPWGPSENCAVTSLVVDQFLGGGKFIPVPPFFIDGAGVTAEECAHTLPTMTGAQIAAVLDRTPVHCIRIPSSPLQYGLTLRAIERAVKPDQRAIVALVLVSPTGQEIGHVTTAFNADGKVVIVDVARAYVGSDWAVCLPEAHVVTEARVWKTGSIAADIARATLTVSDDVDINYQRPFRVQVEGSQSHGAWSLEHARAILRVLSPSGKRGTIERRTGPRSWRRIQGLKGSGRSLVV
jgi:hypothetical protein